MCQRTQGWMGMSHDQKATPVGFSQGYLCRKTDTGGLGPSK